MSITKEWYAAIKIRHSTRIYNGVLLKEEALKALNSLIRDYNPFSGVRAVLVTEEVDEAFKGIIGGYGKVKNAPAYLAFIGDLDDPNVQEKLGYLGEGLILGATELGLATCWIGGFFKRQVVSSKVGLKGNEKVLAISPVGYPAAKANWEERLMHNLAKSYKRKDLEKLLLSPSPKELPNWAQLALEAARLAPSAVNRQPWRFVVEERKVTICLDSPKDSLNISKRLDCGIAMLHLELGAIEAGMEGRWHFLSGNQVAEFL